MNPTRRIIISFLVISLIVSFTLVTSTSQNNSKTLTIQHASDVQSSPANIERYVGIGEPLVGKLVYLIRANVTLFLPESANFTILSLGCGIAVSLFNTTAWQIAQFTYSCPRISERFYPAGSYNFSVIFYINSLKNYTTTNYPRKIGFYVYTSPQFKSNVFYFILQPNKTSSYPNMLVTYENVIVLSSIVILASGMVVIVKFSPSVRKFLHFKTTRTKRSYNPSLKDETLQKLEEIIHENSK